MAVSTRKVSIFILWVSIVVYLIITLVFITGKEKGIPYTAIDVEILDSSTNFFVNKEDVNQVIDQFAPAGKVLTVEMLDLNELENELNNTPSIKKAEIFQTTHKRNDSVFACLRVVVEQHKPILRVMTNRGKDFFIDDDGAIISKGRQNPIRILIANGKIPDPDEGQFCANNEIWNKLYKTALYIDTHRFWKAQIEQVYVNDANEIELTPRIGAHNIILGNAEGLDLKFRKLLAVYKKGFNNVGWNQYRTIDLKYKNQVVCSKYGVYAN